MSQVVGAGRWVEVTPSAFAHEREALDYLRTRLPDRDPYRIWSNFTFIADDGTLNEVDCLVVAPSGVYLIELKSYSGKIAGDSGTWIWTTREGSQRTIDNPLLATDRKAKKLKSLLIAQQALRTSRMRQVKVWIQPLVFLSSPDLSCALTEHARTAVVGREWESEGSASVHSLPGVVTTITQVDPRRGPRVDRPLSQAIAQAMAHAGIRESTAHRQVGPYELGELIAEGPGWQDFLGEHSETHRVPRRIRIYLAGRAKTEDERQLLQRAARREFEMLHDIQHPGIERPLELLTHDRGPALVYDDDPRAQRLDKYLADHTEELDLLARIDLVRKVAEALRHAHHKGVYHRALSAHSIVVTEVDGARDVRIRDWQAGTRQVTTGASSGLSGTSHVAELIDEPARLYLAPETLHVPEAQPRTADVFSLGAIAYLILTGSPPATDREALLRVLSERGHLSLAQSIDAPPQDLDEVVQYATKAEATLRFVSVDELLEYLDHAEELMTRPAEPDPIEARSGDLLVDGSKVLRRFGTGATSVVVLVERQGRQEVLKIARDEDNAARLRDEYQTLKRLRYPSVVQAHDLTEIGGRTVLRLEAAAEGTLARRLEGTGKLSLDLLERWGRDLLEAVAHLEEQGTAHRDIKPDNLGIIERGKNKERHLVLFDFSLTRADPANLRAGTVGYLDPFLEERPQKRWDVRAEQYAVAVTLHEMATGQRPRWGDGSTDPVLTPDKTPHIEADLIDGSVRGGMVEFFEQALHRTPDKRYDTALDMLRAWDRIFTDVGTGTDLDEGFAAEEVILLGKTGASSITELGLKPRVREAIERVGISTLGELRDMPPIDISRLAGVGATTRKEIRHLATRLREELGEGTSQKVSTSGLLPSIDRLTSLLVPQPPADEEHRAAIGVFLGLLDEPVQEWPSQRHVAEVTGFSRDLVADALLSARNRWARLEDLTVVRSQLVELFTSWGGLGGADELAATLLALRGSTAGDPVRVRRARAVVRAAVEAESMRQKARFIVQRVGERMLVASGSEQAGVPGEWDGARLIESAAALGEVADELVMEEPLVPPDQVPERLRSALPDLDTPPWSEPRLVRIAAAASATTAVSSRLELYPVGMTAERTVREARASLLGRGGLTVEQLRERIRARFPDAKPLPPRPELDRLLDEAETGLTWRTSETGEGKFFLDQGEAVLSTSMSARSTTSSDATDDVAAGVVRRLDERLRTLARDGGFLALTVDRRRLREARHIVTRAVEGVLVDIDALLVQAMRAKAEDYRANWERLLQADAEEVGSQGRRALNTLVRGAIGDVEQQLLDGASVVVASPVGLLARYNQIGLLERLRNRLTFDPAQQVLRTLIVLVPGDDPTAPPTIDGHAVPIVTANQWGYMSGAWLRTHRQEDAA